LTDFSRTYLQTHPDVHFFIFGHLHILLDREITPSARMFVVGDWMEQFSYAVWDGENVALKQF
jgi:UDP-2,3-diacylglucosamine hydrolase